MLNCLTLAMVDLCDLKCNSLQCKGLAIAEHTIFSYFVIEMIVKLIAMGIRGPGSYFTNTWHRFDSFVVFTGILEYVFSNQDFNISALRALRILRPLRAITRIPSLRILVAWVIDILPLMGNALIFCLFLFFVFAVIAVQLWAGVMRQRCFFPKTFATNATPPSYMPEFYDFPHKDFICSQQSGGFLTCDKIPQFEKSVSLCVELFSIEKTKLEECRRWVGNYTDCRAEADNPESGISFDHIGVASITVFQVISLQGWANVMYTMQDAFSFWSWIYFVVVVLTGAYFAVKLCLVIVAAQFTVTLHREKARRKAERARRRSMQLGDVPSIDEEIDTGFYEQTINSIIYVIREVLVPKLKSVKILAESKKQPIQNSLHRRHGKVWQGIDFCRACLRKMFEAAWVQAVIFIFIIINGAMMGLEHHGQEETFTEIVEKSHVVFTIIFIVEILLRCFAYGLEAFVREPFNMLDTLIVIANLIEVIGHNTNSSLSALRLFRLLRLVKIVRFFPNMQTQLMLMFHTVGQTAIFFILFAFILFVLALLGMNLFSCQPCDFNQGLCPTSSNFSKVASCKAVVVELENTTPPTQKRLCTERKFDGIFNSMFTVLQIFTRDKWSFIMRDTMRNTSKWASLYFIALITIGNYCIFNILVGILVEGFSERREKTLRRRLLPDQTKIDKTNNTNTQRSTHISNAKSTIYNLMNGCGNERSLFIFSLDNSFRKSLQKFLATKYYDSISLIITLSTFVVIAFEKPAINEESSARRNLDIASYTLSLLFALEALAKITAFGFVLGEKTYLRSGFNCLDFFLVSLAGIELLLKLMFQNSSNRVIITAFRPMRLFRALRPLRMISRSEGLRNVLKSLVLSFKPILTLVIICCFFFVIFGILGVQLFKGCYARCILPDGHENLAAVLDGGHSSINLTTLEVLANVKTRRECLANGFEWQKDHNNFDNFLNALMTLFVVATRAGWANIARTGGYCLGPDIQPTGEIRYSGYLFTISFVFIVCLFALNLFVGAVVNSFQKVQKKYKISKPPGLSEIKPDQNNSDESFLQEYSKWRKCLYRFVTNQYFECVFTWLISANIIMLAMEHYQMEPFMNELLDITNMVFFGFLCLEFVLKVVALGPVRYIRDKWNVLDLTVLMLSLLGILVEHIDPEGSTINPSAIRIARIFRIVRVVKLVKAAKTLQRILDTVAIALPKILNLSVLFIMVFFMYASVGVQVFGRFDCDIRYCHILSRHANFRNFGMAVLTLFKVFTGDEWNPLLQDILHLASGDKYCSDVSGDISGISCNAIHYIAPLYFVSFILLAQFILINIVVAVLMEQISNLSKSSITDGEESSENETDMSKGLSIDISPLKTADTETSSLQNFVQLTTNSTWV